VLTPLLNRCQTAFTSREHCWLNLSEVVSESGGALRNMLVQNVQNVAQVLKFALNQEVFETLVLGRKYRIYLVPC
jgi:hypothetical protein